MRMWKTNEAVVFILLTNFSVISQVKGRYVHQAIDCSTADVPRCSSLTSESCQTHCVNLGFINGSCDPQGDCCICIPDRPPSPPPEPLWTPPAENDPDTFARSNIVDVIDALERESENEQDCHDHNDICLTPECIQSAASLLDKMNPKVDPCDNFYEFACGGFVEKTTIPDDATEVHPLSRISDKLTEQIRILVETPSVLDEAKPFRLVKHMYNSCVNIPIIESHGLKPLEDALNKLGGWPVVDKNLSWKAENWDWLSSISQFKKNGYSSDYFIGLSINPDLKNSTRNVIAIGEPALSISREQFKMDRFVAAYHKYQVDLAILLGARPETAQKEMGDVLEFERKLANISIPPELKRNATKFYNPISLTNLQKKFPTVPWLAYLQQVLPSTVKVRRGELIILSSPSHLTNLLKLLESTDKRILANYVMWRAAAASIRYLNGHARSIEFNFARTTTGLRELPPRWKECVSIVSSSFPHAIGAMYVRRHFNKDARNVAVEMVDDIRQAFLDSLENIDWMDNKTKSLAWEKASTMTSHIGFPLELLDDQKLTDMYKDLEFNSVDHLQNVLELAVAAGKYNFEKLRETNEKSDWRAYGKAAVANAFYSPIQNSIQFPAGILQENFFGNERPKYMNYGAIGWVIGHEITHGFDDQGRLFDAEGNLKEWWDPFTKESYLKKTQCIVKQYGEYEFVDPLHKLKIPLNGLISQGENIADNGGIQQAYNGYQSWVLRNGQEKKLPGLSYNPNQLFWISAAHNWCSKLRPESMIQKIVSSVHLPGEFRIRGSFANMNQFSKDFNCPAKSKMNPVNKCNVW